MLVLDSAAVSTTGPRPDNQDSACATRLLIAIADGVGGNVGGAVASSLVINWLAPLGSGLAPGRVAHEAEHGSGEDGGDPPAGSTGQDDVARVVAAANERIRVAYSERPRLRSMATTMTAMYVDGAGVLLAHVGDSRGYRLREGELVQVTTDHTLVQTMIDAGELTVEEARVHPQRSAVYAALHGGDDDLAGLDLLRLDVRPGDRLMVCSDGLSDVVRPHRIAEVLAAGTPSEAAQALRQAALTGPPTDNITVAVGDVREAVPGEDPGMPCTVGAAVDFREETAEALEAVWPGPVPVPATTRRR